MFIWDQSMFAELFLGLGALAVAAPFDPAPAPAPPDPDHVLAPQAAAHARRGRPPGRTHTDASKVQMKLSHSKRKASELTKHAQSLSAALTPSRDTEAVAAAFGDCHAKGKSSRHCMINSEIVTDRLSHKDDSWKASRTRGTGSIFSLFSKFSYDLFGFIFF